MAFCTPSVPWGPFYKHGLTLIPAWLALLYKIVHGHVAVLDDALKSEPPDPRTHPPPPYSPLQTFLFCAALFPSGSPSLPALSRPHLLSLSRLIWQGGQPWSGTSTHPRHTPEEDCGLLHQTRPEVITRSVKCVRNHLSISKLHRLHCWSLGMDLVLSWYVICSPPPGVLRRWRECLIRASLVWQALMSRAQP